MSQPRYLPIPIKLQSPANLDGQAITELTMRPPTTTDVILAEKATSTAYEKDVMLYANLTETTEDFIKELNYYDYLQLDSAFDLFLQPLPQHLELLALRSQKQQGEAASENLLTSPSTNSTAG